MDNVNSQVLGALTGCAIFDALGLPTEGKTYEQIAVELPEAHTEFLRCPESHPAFEEHFPGKWSDDTQLTLGLCRSFIDMRGIDMRDIAKKHVEAAEESIMGWGTATRESVGRLRENDLDYFHSGQMGVGNGVIMKMVPFVLMLYYKMPNVTLEERDFLIKQFTQMTHTSPIALICSYVHGHMLEKIIESDSSFLKSKEGRYDFLHTALAHAKKYEKDLEEEGTLSGFLQNLINHFEELPHDRMLIKLSNGGGFYVPETIAMTYGLFASSVSFNSAHRAVRLGGDSDSNASIVASMVGLVEGVNGLSPVLREKVWRSEEIERTAKNFTEVLENL